MGSTSGLVKITAARNAGGIVKYNMKTTKTQGQWSTKSKPVTQKDLVGFYGTSHHPGLSLQDQGKLFAKQADNNARLSNIYKANAKHRIMYDDIPNRMSTCHTIVQSFDYKANPTLQPKEVHEMGEQLLVGVKHYLKSRYNYDLDGGMISTHIDDNKDVKKYNYNHKKHLHNHIVIMSFNDNGTSISPYLRIPDLYSFKQINDKVASNHSLKDYYFLKLDRETKPNSSFTKHRSRNAKHHSDLQKAVSRFTRANDHAFDKHPKLADFKLAKQDRNQELTMKYDYKTKDKKDSRTNRIRHLFTMKDFSRKNHHTRWYSIDNLRLLAWKNEQDERAERLIRQFRFGKVKRKSVSYPTYKKSIEDSLQQLPQLQKINNTTKRNNHKVTINVSRVKVKPKIHSSYQDFIDYLNKIKRDEEWRKNSYNPYDKKHHREKPDFIASNFSNITDEVNKHNKQEAIHNKKVAEIKNKQNNERIQRNKAIQQKHKKQHEKQIRIKQIKEYNAKHGLDR